MNRKRYSSMLFGLLALSLILFGIPFKAFAFHTGSESDLAANPELITFRNLSYSVADSGALKIDSVRWSALGVYFAQNLARLHSAEVDSARWSAIGDFYVARGRDADSVRWSAIGDSYVARGRDADVARWSAIGDSYVARGRDADAARWSAVGSYYGGIMAGVTGVDAIGAFHADEARQAALDAYFKALVARYAGGDVLGALYASRYLGENPELILVGSDLLFIRSEADLVSNPELLSLQRYNICGC